MTRRKHVLILGDLLTLTLVVFSGFAAHGGAGAAFLPRLLALYLPLSVSWFLLASWLRLFNPENTASLGQFWRPALTVIAAAGLAVVVRSILLNTPVLPAFAAVLAGSVSLGIVLWRALFLAWNRKAS